MVESHSASDTVIPPVQLLARKPTYNREKFLAEEFRRGGEVPSSGQSRIAQSEMNQLLNKIKNEMREADKSPAVAKTDTSSAILKNTNLIKIIGSPQQPSKLEKALAQIKEDRSLGASNLLNGTDPVVLKTTLASDALKKYNSSLNQEKLIQNVASSKA